MVFRPDEEGAREEAGARWHTDAYMLGFYYNMKIENPEHRTIYPEDSEKVKSAIASALRAPMTRVLLMTKGLDVSSAIEIVDIPRPQVVVSGDLYVRLARIYANEGHLEYDIIDALDNSTDPVQKLEEFVRDWGFAASPFECRLSASKQQVSCIHETCCLESLESLESRRTDKRAKRDAQDESTKEKGDKWRDRVAVSREGARAPARPRPDRAVLVRPDDQSLPDKRPDRRLVLYRAANLQVQAVDR